MREPDFSVLWVSGRGALADYNEYAGELGKRRDDELPANPAQGKRDGSVAGVVGIEPAEMKWRFAFPRWQVGWDQDHLPSASMTDLL